MARDRFLMDPARLGQKKLEDVELVVNFYREASTSPPTDWPSQLEFQLNTAGPYLRSTLMNVLHYSIQSNPVEGGGVYREHCPVCRRHTYLTYQAVERGTETEDEVVNCCCLNCGHEDYQCTPVTSD